MPNKIDLIFAGDRQRLMRILQRLNPRAHIEVAEFGQLLLDKVLDTGLFDFEQASEAPIGYKNCAVRMCRKVKSTALPVLPTAHAFRFIRNVFLI